MVYWQISPHLSWMATQVWDRRCQALCLTFRCRLCEPPAFGFFYRLTTTIYRVVRNQNLNMAVDPLFASSTFGNTLTTLDLSFNSLTGALPFIFLPHLTNLNLANNNFTTLSQTLTFPPLLQTLSLQNNPLLNGTISTALCTNSLLTSCSFQGTVFSTVTNITCGSCQFR